MRSLSGYRFYFDCLKASSFRSGKPMGRSIWSPPPPLERSRVNNYSKNLQSDPPRLLSTQFIWLTCYLAHIRGSSKKMLLLVFCIKKENSLHAVGHEKIFLLTQKSSHPKIKWLAPNELRLYLQLSVTTCCLIYFHGNRSTKMTSQVAAI